MISVVIPLYNKEKYIERCIHSVLNQTFQNFEIVIVNDGSTDNSVFKVENIHDQRIQIIHQPNSGVSAARNEGIKNSRFDYIAFIDADDEWTNDHLEVISHLIETYPSCAVFGTSYLFKKENEEVRSPHITQKFPFKGDDGILSNYFEIASGTDFPIHMSSYAVKKSAIEKIGGFPKGIVTGEDILTLAKLHIENDFAYSRNETAIYHLMYTGKNDRPTLKKNPMDQTFDSLINVAPHRKGVKLYVSSWHKRRMVGALLTKQYNTAFKQFLCAFRIYPIQKKLYTALISSLISLATGKDLYSINKFLKRKR